MTWPPTEPPCLTSSRTSERQQTDLSAVTKQTIAAILNDVDVLKVVDLVEYSYLAPTGRRRPPTKPFFYGARETIGTAIQGVRYTRGIFSEYISLDLYTSTSRVAGCDNIVERNSSLNTIQTDTETQQKMKDCL